MKKRRTWNQDRGEGGKPGWGRGRGEFSFGVVVGGGGERKETT